MYLRPIINTWLCLLILALCPVISFSQESDVSVDSPYRSEYNPWFKLGVFQRGYKNEHLAARLDSLESKPRKYWSRQDSLNFAEVSKKTGNLDLSAYYFDHLNVDYKREERFWWERLVVHFLQHEYNACLRVIRDAEPGLVEYSKLWFFKKICDAKLRSLKDEKWAKKESVLSWEIDSTLLTVDKESDLFREKVITPLENLNFVLELLIRHIYEDDEVIARTCLEMGWILRAYISPTQAFLAMSLGRNYDQWDKEILENIRQVKAELIEKHYRIPVFRKNFPRIEPWRFDYELLKEKIIYEREDTAVRTAPKLYKEPEKKYPEFNGQLVILIGLTIMFLCLLLFLRIRKK
ncbi:MAG: hypothetical protein HYZ14_09795 [Bacteroidetes bacterium]|nr:hypothetical protein [Bacteroidota bacterium]